MAISKVKNVNQFAGQKCRGGTDFDFFPVPGMDTMIVNGVPISSVANEKREIKWWIRCDRPPLYRFMSRGGRIACETRLQSSGLRSRAWGTGPPTERQVLRMGEGTKNLSKMNAIQPLVGNLFSCGVERGVQDDYIPKP